MHEIYFSVDNDLVEHDVMQKEWRGDVLVKIGRNYYHPTIMTLARLTKEFQDAMEDRRVYEIDANLILVRDTSKRTILDTLRFLIGKGYFLQVKQIALRKYLRDYEKKLQNIRAWVKVD